MQLSIYAMAAAAASTVAASAVAVEASCRSNITWNGKVAFVITRFHETLQPWVDVAALTYLYDTGSNSAINDSAPHDSFRQYNHIPNIGREGHSHVLHIVNNWDHLEDVIFFGQAAPFDNFISPVANNSLQLLALAPHTTKGQVNGVNPSLYHQLATWGPLDQNCSDESLWFSKGDQKSLKPTSLTVADYWTKVTGETSHPAAWTALHGGSFFVTRETIKSRSKQVYQNALDIFQQENATNPMEGFYLERLWTIILSEQQYSLQNATGLPTC